MNNLNEWRLEFSNHRNLILLSLLFLGIALVLNYIAGTYVDGTGTTVATDIILDHTIIINLSFLFIYGIGFVITVLFLYPLFFNVKETHIVISQFSLLVLIRSFFVSLTHLRAPADAIIMSSSSVYDVFFFNNDLFFSAHTAIPFLGYLLFRKEKVALFFLCSTVILAMTVLLMHVHYSIDVFAAIFIAYGSYRLGNWLFGKIERSVPNKEF